MCKTNERRNVVCYGVGAHALRSQDYRMGMVCWRVIENEKRRRRAHAGLVLCAEEQYYSLDGWGVSEEKGATKRLNGLGVGVWKLTARGTELRKLGEEEVMRRARLQRRKGWWEHRTARSLGSCASAWPGEGIYINPALLVHSSLLNTLLSTSFKSRSSKSSWNFVGCCSFQNDER